MQIARTALVPYSTEDMYRLVHDVPAYPDFLSWCVDAEVLEQDAHTQLAALTVSVGGIRQRFVTRNRLEPGRALHMSLVEGAFRRLGGAWTFTPLAELGSKVALELGFEMDTSLVAAAFSAGFARVADRMVRDFCKRADAVYGAAETP
jgi:ribosome-associated toxin RatA of RatAB toxin-antitoxin module